MRFDRWGKCPSWNNSLHSAPYQNSHNVTTDAAIRSSVITRMASIEEMNKALVNVSSAETAVRSAETAHLDIMARHAQMAKLVRRQRCKLDSLAVSDASDSLKEAEEFTGCHNGKISAICRGKYSLGFQGYGGLDECGTALATSDREFYTSLQEEGFYPESRAEEDSWSSARKRGSLVTERQDGRREPIEEDVATFLGIG